MYTSNKAKPQGGKFKTFLHSMMAKGADSTRNTFEQKALKRNGRVLSIQKPNNYFTTYNTYSNSQTL